MKRPGGVFWTVVAVGILTVIALTHNAYSMYWSEGTNYPLAAFAVTLIIGVAFNCGIAFAIALGVREIITRSQKKKNPCCEYGPPGHTQQQHHDASPCYNPQCTFAHPNGGPYVAP